MSPVVSAKARELLAKWIAIMLLQNIGTRGSTLGRSYEKWALINLLKEEGFDASTSIDCGYELLRAEFIQESYRKGGERQFHVTVKGLAYILLGIDS